MGEGEREGGEMTDCDREGTKEGMKGRSDSDEG
jgi:hypothetical protein